MLLEQLSNAFGVSGVEDDVRKIIIKAAQPYADEWHIDAALPAATALLGKAAGLNAKEMKVRSLYLA